jgi:thiamine monophosphate synthase
VKRYCITDSIEVVRRAMDLNADLIQIRAKELIVRDLMRLVEKAVVIAGKRVLVNTRADIALACGAGGVHLPANSPTAALRAFRGAGTRACRVETSGLRICAGRLDAGGSPGKRVGMSADTARTPGTGPQTGSAYATRQDFLIGVSCHNIGELQTAERDGADFAVFGPVFESPGKGPAVGVEALRVSVRSVAMPVYALGGVTEENAELCLEAGAYGIAGIRLFSGFE